MDRPNLTVVTRALAHRILFDGTRATGVEYSTRGGRNLERVEAGEVVLCGGAFNSPQLLQLSGVGDTDHLRTLGIAPVHHLPAVGQHLQDHLEVYIQYECLQPVSIQPWMAMWKRPLVGLMWLFRKGPGATNHFEGGGFVRSNDDVAYPNLMFHFLPIAIRYDGTPSADGGHGYQVHIGPMYSDARGDVQITSTNPRTKPAIRFNYLSTEQDRREWVESIRVARNILNQPAMDAVQRRRDLTRAVGRHRRGDPASGSRRTPRPRCTRRARAGWARGRRHRLGDRPAHDGGARRRRASAWSTPRRCATSRTATSTPR